MPLSRELDRVCVRAASLCFVGFVAGGNGGWRPPAERKLCRDSAVSLNDSVL